MNHCIFRRLSGALLLGALQLCAFLQYAAVPCLAGQAAAPDAQEIQKQVDALLPGLGSDDPAALKGASESLERMGLEAGRPGAADARKAVGKAVAARLGSDVKAPARILLVRQLEVMGREECVLALAALLKDEREPVLRESARRALEANPAPQAVRALRQACAAAGGGFRAALIGSLGKRRDTLAVGFLLDDARAEDAAVRFAALDALAEIGDRSAVDVFEDILSKDGAADTRVRRAYLRLAEAMAEGDEGGAGRRIFIRALGFGGADRIAAIAGLGRFGLPADAPVLLDALGDADPQVRAAAREGLVKLRGAGKAILERMASAGPDLKKDLQAILEKRGDPAAPAAVAPKLDLAGVPSVGAQLYIWTQHFGGKGQRMEDHLDEVFAGTRAAGFEAVQGWLSFYDSPEAAEKTTASLKRHGLAMPSAYTGGALHTEAAAKGAIEAILRQARIGRPHGLKIVVMNPDGVGREKTDEELAVQAKGLDRLGGELTALGMALAIHTHDPEMRSNAREWYHMLRNTDGAKVGFCLDLHWVLRGHQDPYKLLADAGKRTIDLHLRNSVGGVWSEDLGDGEIDHKKIREILDRIGFTGLYTVELAYEGGTKPIRSLQADLGRSREYIRTVLGK